MLQALGLGLGGADACRVAVLTGNVKGSLGVVG